MEIRVNFVINCFIFIPYLLAKPFSLNKAIGEEVRRKLSSQTTSRSKSAEAFVVKLNDKSIQLPSITIPSQKDRLKDYPAATNRRTSAKYRKAFKINPPLRPKRLNSQQKLQYKLRNKTGKRAIENNEIFSQKYIPFLKSLSMLFDNFFNPDKSESLEIIENQYRNHQYSNNIDEQECSCAFKPYKMGKKLRPHKTATTLTTAFPVEISDDFPTIAFTETATPATDNTATGHISSYERDKNLPVLLTGNPSSRRRNNNGICKGNSSTNYRSSERYFSGNYGDNECNTRSAKNASFTQYYEKFPISTPRYYASGVGYPRRLSRNKNNSRNSENRSTTKLSNTTEETSNEKLRRSYNILKEENKYQAGGHEAKSTVPLRNLHTGVRRYTIEDKAKSSKPTTTNKNSEESNINVPFHGTSNKRLFDGNGPNTGEDQKICRKNETVTSTLPFNTIAPTGNKTALVTIFDGYSVARDVNGENKLAEKAVLIHT